MKKKFLDEYDHPYHCDSNEYFSYDSFEEFKEEWGGEVDVDLNRIHRWDVSEGEVQLHYILQRKGYTTKCVFPYSREIDQELREFLQPHKDYNHNLWDI